MTSNSGPALLLLLPTLMSVGVVGCGSRFAARALSLTSARQATPLALSASTQRLKAARFAKQWGQETDWMNDSELKVANSELQLLCSVSQTRQ
jgi:predicted dehydrogenase